MLESLSDHRLFVVICDHLTMTNGSFNLISVLKLHLKINTLPTFAHFFFNLHQQTGNRIISFCSGGLFLLSCRFSDMLKLSSASGVCCLRMPFGMHPVSRCLFLSRNGSSYTQLSLDYRIQFCLRAKINPLLSGSFSSGYVIQLDTLYLNVYFVKNGKIHTKMLKTSKKKNNKVYKK